MVGDQSLDRVGMDVGDDSLGLGQRRRPIVAVADPGGSISAERSTPARRRCTAGGAGAEAGNGLAVGLEQRYVDPVHRSAAHRADSAHGRHGSRFP